MCEILCAFNEFRINGFHNIPKRLIVAVKKNVSANQNAIRVGDTPLGFALNRRQYSGRATLFH